MEKAGIRHIHQKENLFLTLHQRKRNIKLIFHCALATSFFYYMLVYLAIDPKQVVPLM